MKMQRFVGAVGVGLCGLLCLVLFIVPSGGQTTANEQWGVPTQGLQMSISVPNPDKSGKPEFQMAIRNVGEKGIILNLGMIHAAAQIPTNIRLTLVDDTGTKRKLEVSTPNIAGRVDDYIVPLRVGSTYILKLKLGELWWPNQIKTGFKLNPGKYRVSAQFVGSGAKHINSGMEGIKSIDFWKGTLQSNTLTFEQ